jgi:predicted DNA-binding helix-hairpin-helix protein
MGQTHERIVEAKAERRRFSPAGQSTQVIVGADDTTDESVLATSALLYDRYGLKRVYYSAFSRSPSRAALLPLKAAAAPAREPALPGRLAAAALRLHRGRDRGGRRGRHARPRPDPKLAWALKNRDRFPVDVNTAPRELLLRIPGPRQAGGRPHPRRPPARRLRLADIARLTASLKRALPFLVALDHRPRSLDRARPPRPARPAARAALPVRRPVDRPAMTRARPSAELVQIPLGRRAPTRTASASPSAG